jgi:DNA primase
VAEAMPERATVESRKAKRKDRVYIDVLQNARGHHAVPPDVLRAVPAATISTPLRWEEVMPEPDPAAFTPATIFRRMSRLRLDPIAGLLKAGTARSRRQGRPHGRPRRRRVRRRRFGAWRRNR